MYLRFVVGSDDENAYWLTGIFVEARLLLDDGRLYRHEADWLESTFDWYNEHLPCPPFSSRLRSGEWTRNAVSWFRDDAGEPLKRMWDIVALLQEHGAFVRLVRSDRPGEVVYRDRYQVVAETPRWA